MAALPFLERYGPLHMGSRCGEDPQFNCWKLSSELEIIAPRLRFHTAEALKACRNTLKATGNQLEAY